MMAQPSDTVNEIQGWKKLALGMLALLIRLWTLTLRIRIPEEEAEVLRKQQDNVLILLWHNRLFVGAEAYRRIRGSENKMHGLVSASKDGAWLSAFFRSSGIVPIRGSSSRRGVQAVIELIHALREKGDIGITLDGPRGPVYCAQPGAAWIAAKVRPPIVMFNVRYHSFWRLKSWDRFYVPKPFSRVDFELEEIEELPEVTDSSDKETLRKYLEDRLRAFSADT